MRKVGVGFDYYGNVIIVGDIVKVRFKLDNPWKVIEIYMIDINTYNYHIGKGTEDIWLNYKEVEFVSHDDGSCILANWIQKLYPLSQKDKGYNNLTVI